MMLKENEKLLKLLVIYWISKSFSPVAVATGWFGLSWKVSPSRAAPVLQAEQAGAEAIAELWSFSGFLVLAVAQQGLFQSSVSETRSRPVEAQQREEKKEVDKLRVFTDCRSSWVVID